MGACCLAGWFDPPVRFTSETRRARKQHTCCECGATIEKGEEYQNISGIWDRKYDHFKRCMPCEDLDASLSEVMCTYYGDLMNEYMTYLEYEGLLEYDEDNDVYLYPDNHMTRAQGLPTRKRT